MTSAGLALQPDRNRHRVVAIIPARGKSQGIPRKNARLLNGTPLILHVIRTAQAARHLDAIYVSTDDPELAELARRSGTAVLERTPRLAEPQATLDEVIVDAARMLEARGERVDYAVTLQPTCPMISPRTIDAVVRKCQDEALDTVFTVVNDTHLTWGIDAQGAPVPLYDARVNRQQLPAVYRETGAVVAANRVTLERGGRFGTRVGMVEVAKAESIDIDDHFDWWLADKSLRRRCIVFNVVGNTQLGLGHVYRALTLADRLIDHELRFLTTEDSPLATKLIRRRLYPVDVVAPGSELDYLLADPPDLLINDVLNTGAELVTRVQDAGARVINFEDVGPGSIHADCVINALYAGHPERRDRDVHHGVDYCCLRDEFYTINPIEMKKKVENVLLLFGGTDPTGVTERFLWWVDALNGDFSITVIAGVGFSRRRKLQQAADNARHPVELVYDTNVISRYMARADLAVTSAGRTVFELAALGVPMVVLPHHERELSHSFACTSLGAVCLGTVDEVSQHDFSRTMEQLLNGELLRAKMHDALIQARVRDGLERVLDIINRTLSLPREAS